MKKRLTLELRNKKPSEVPGAVRRAAGAAGWGGVGKPGPHVVRGRQGDGGRGEPGPEGPARREGVEREPGVRSARRGAPPPPAWRRARARRGPALGGGGGGRAGPGPSRDGGDGRRGRPGRAGLGCAALAPTAPRPRSKAGAAPRSHGGSAMLAAARACPGPPLRAPPPRGSGGRAVRARRPPQRRLSRCQARAGQPGAVWVPELPLPPPGLNRLNFPAPGGGSGAARSPWAGPGAPHLPAGPREGGCPLSVPGRQRDSRGLSLGSGTSCRVTAACGKTACKRSFCWGFVAGEGVCRTRTIGGVAASLWGCGSALRWHREGFWGVRARVPLREGPARLLLLRCGLGRALRRLRAAPSQAGPSPGDARARRCARTDKMVALATFTPAVAISVQPWADLRCREQHELSYKTLG